MLLGAGGVALGWDWADPAVGLLITVAILAVLRQAAREVYRRLMDAVDPALVDRAEQALRATPGVRGTGEIRLRWSPIVLVTRAGTSAGRTCITSSLSRRCWGRPCCRCTMSVTTAG